MTNKITTLAAMTPTTLVVSECGGMLRLAFPGEKVEVLLTVEGANALRDRIAELFPRPMPAPAAHPNARCIAEPCEMPNWEMHLDRPDWAVGVGQGSAGDLYWIGEIISGNLGATRAGQPIDLSGRVLPFEPSALHVVAEFPKRGSVRQCDPHADWTATDSELEEAGLSRYAHPWLKAPEWAEVRLANCRDPKRQAWAEEFVEGARWTSVNEGSKGPSPQLDPRCWFVLAKRS